ncbi:unnamed protein product [Allacma fusca]|uniref:guanylate cyclase n=1 Tax=Allacma fusca TaxID=39272 RepID=A0A8J2KNR6_9HEXA|nr:unnamed protein product [Allacma fusca]
MYGLLLENLAAFVKIQWGESKWDSVRRHAGVDAPSFSAHHVYAETLIPRLARSAVQVLDVSEREFFEAMGVYFVEFVGQYGYDQVMSVLGRHMRDFLNGLDNLHEYLKFSYPRMRAPSFFCENETSDGLLLHYRSKRRGFVYYTMGQIKQVAKHFYNTVCEIDLKSEELDGDTMHVIFQLRFDNRAYCEAAGLITLIREEQQLPVKASMIFELFPFCLAFCPNMVIRYTGHSLLAILKDLCGQCITQAFDLIRPLISFTFTSILERRNNVFELVTTAPLRDEESIDGILDDDDGSRNLRLKGQMLYMEQWNMMLYLATPLTPDLDALTTAGLYINDLSLHDCSRDLVLAGTQQSVELKLALDQEQQKSRKLEESMKKLDEEMKRTDELLYQMIPKQVADRIRRGENPVDTCEVFETVSVLFSDVVTFTEICSRISPMQVVSMLNHMYSLFDQLTERNGVYKVETIGDAYMVVSGAPVKDMNHSERICDMALDMIDASVGIKDPSGTLEHLKLRVGVHSGTVVAGVVGLKMPRYCLFGDTVNTASRMETTSEAGRIQISEVTKNLLPNTYETEFRGAVPMKGKGEMSTFWLLGRNSRIPLSELQCNSFSWAAPIINLASDRVAYTPVVDVVTARRNSITSSSSILFSKASDNISTDTSMESFSRNERGGSRGRQMRGMSHQDSVRSESGHIPILTHQPTLEDMNLDAAKQSCSSIISRKGSNKNLTSGDSKSSLSSSSPKVTFNEPLSKDLASRTMSVPNFVSGSTSDILSGTKPLSTSSSSEPVVFKLSTESLNVEKVGEERGAGVNSDQSS